MVGIWIQYHTSLLAEMNELYPVPSCCKNKKTKKQETWERAAVSCMSVGNLSRELVRCLIEEQPANRMSNKDAGVMKLYGDSISGNCLKCKWTADFLKIPYEWVEINVLKGETRTDEFLSINPVGQVPVARWPDGRTLSQSNAIVLFLAEGSSLIPAADPCAKAQMHSWMFWEQYSHETAIAVRRFQKLYLKKPDDEIDPNLFIKGNKALSILERQLSDSDWLVGGGGGGGGDTALTCADIALVAYTRMAPDGGFDLSYYPSVIQWIRRVEKALGIAPIAEY